MCRLLTALFVCFSLLALSAHGQQWQNPSNWPNRNNGEDHFSGLDPMTGNNNAEYPSTEPNPYYPNGNQNFELPPDNGRPSSTVMGGQQNGNNRPRPSDRPNQGTTSTTPSTSGNSAVLNTCNAECKTRIVMEYNPVCGSNDITYQNIRFLRCVADCSRSSITMSYVGKCAAVVSQ